MKYYIFIEKQKEKIILVIWIIIIQTGFYRLFLIDIILLQHMISDHNERGCKYRNIEHYLSRVFIV